MPRIRILSVPILITRMEKISKYLLSLLILAAVAAGSSNLLSLENPEAECTVSIFATGNWAGNFGMDDEGHSGLAALHSLVQRKRELLRTSCGGVVLLHVGNFTGASNQSELENRLHPWEMNLVRYLGFSAMAFSFREIELLKSTRDPALLSLPVVSYNLSAAFPSAARRFIFVPGRETTVLVSALTPGNVRTDPEELDRLIQEMDKHSGVDARVILLNRIGPVRRASSESAEKMETQSLLNESDFVDRLGSINAVYSSPFTITGGEESWKRTLVIEEDAPHNSFYTLNSGVTVCRIHGRSVCQIDLKFRSRKFTGMSQQFIELNGPREPGSRVEGDRRLLRMYR